MERIAWIGPGSAAMTLKDLFSKSGIEFYQYDDVQPALAQFNDCPVSAAIVSADWGEATSTIQQLATARPEVQILAATRLGVPVHLSMVLQQGASSVLDLRARDSRELTAQIQDALRRHREAVRQRELLQHLYELNEEFLKNMVVLEKKNVELEEQLNTKDGAEQEDAGSSSRRILIVDDEPSVRQLFEIVLQDSGFEVVVVESGEAGLDAARQNRFDIVITDKNLPGISGIDVMREIKAMKSDSEVIMITGYASKESAIDAVNIGAAAFLEKPFDDIEAVVEKITAVADRRDERKKRAAYINHFKDRNREFLQRYRVVRAGLEHWLHPSSQPPSGGSAERG